MNSKDEHFLRACAASVTFATRLRYSLTEIFRCPKHKDEARSRIALLILRKHFLIFLFLTRPLGGSDSHPLALLKEVALHYETASDYYLEVRATSSASLDGSADGFDFVLAASRPRKFMMRQRSFTSDRFELLIIASDSSTLGYLPLKKRYTEETGSGTSEAREELREVHDRYFGRFRLLDRIDADVKFVGSGTAGSGGKVVACLRIKLISSDGSWAEEMWVDPKLSRVLKSVFRRKGVVSTTVWRECRMNEPVNSALFRLQVPVGTQLTNVLEFR